MLDKQLDRSDRSTVETVYREETSNFLDDFIIATETPNIQAMIDAATETRKPCPRCGGYHA